MNSGDHYQPKRAVPVRKTDSSPNVIAFYLPQYHCIPENDRWWGKGFTEWTNVSRAVAQYTGHNQPRIPDALGHYDLSKSESIRKQIDLAQYYGIHGFCLYYYWFNGRRLLEKPLNLILQDESLNFPFCICWANENWTRSWDGGHRNILMRQSYGGLESDQRFIRDLIPIISDRRYIRLDGKPIVLIYRPSVIPDFANRVDTWRELLRQQGIGDVLFLMVQSFWEFDPEPYHLDGAVEFPPHNGGFEGQTINNQHTFLAPSFPGKVFSYEQLYRNYLTSKAMNTTYTWFRGCCLEWDNTARRVERGTSYPDYTPGMFGRWLDELARYTADNARCRGGYLFVNAWNEWAEGTYLEPDKMYGYAALNEVATVLETHYTKPASVP